MPLGRLATLLSSMTQQGVKTRSTSQKPPVAFSLRTEVDI
jgi:hypothetical protein